ncbi:MAG: SDR family NAD(P)-dependent oxidoreductase [Acidimicrobiia bacterium]
MAGEPSTHAVDLDGRVALVTGGAAGLGRAYAELLGARGARVVVNDLAGAPEAAGRLAAAGVEAVADEHDIAAPGAAAAIVQRALDAFGRLDVLVNNAGISEQVAVDELTDDAVARILDINLRASIDLTRAAWPALRAAGGGRVVNTSSPTILGNPLGIAYQSSKTGILGLTRSTALAGAKEGIKVNAVMPMAHTPMVDRHGSEPFRTILEQHFPATEVAPLVAVLSSSACPVSGSAFLVGGGRVAHVVLAMTAAHVAPGATPEDVLAALPGVLDPASLWVPVDRADELARGIADLGIEVDGPVAPTAAR